MILLKFSGRSWLARLDQKTVLDSFEAVLRTADAEEDKDDEGG